MINGTVDIVSYTREELKALFQEIGEPAYREDQLFSWIHQKRVLSFEDMTNLSEKTRSWLRENAVYERPEVIRKQVSSDGTEKYLLGFSDGNCVETVAMEYEHGVSLCISTQVGCRMGCAFCASTVNGLVRSLTASEMLMEV